MAAFTCLAGTLAQETYHSHPRMRDACRDSIAGHAHTLEAEFAAATDAAGRHEALAPAGPALQTQVVLQGGFVVAKADGDGAPVRAAITHFKRYLSLLLKPPVGCDNAAGTTVTPDPSPLH